LVKLKLVICAPILDLSGIGFFVRGSQGAIALLRRSAKPIAPEAGRDRLAQ
jgi:hypothetical protein